LLSYRHSFHAGNHADVLKHTVLLACVSYFLKKDKPFVYLDSHAGAGFYQLKSRESQTTAEYEAGIGRLWNLPMDSLPDALARYVKVIKSVNPSNGLDGYPGSPWLSLSAMRVQDKARLYELHSTDERLLRQNFSADKRVRIEKSDGLAGVKACLPVPERRALVLIDPSYELKEDYQAVVTALKEGHKRMATATFLLWYPVVERHRITRIERALVESGIKDILLAELAVERDSPGHGMTASGMIVINPPWTLKAELEETLPFLVKHLAQKPGAFSRLETLVGEA
jgi:23S rRNA (adenine2030-N6)-methyltransferase